MSKTKTKLRKTYNPISLETKFQVIEQRAWHVTTFKNLSQIFRLTMPEVTAILYDSKRIRRQWFYMNSMPARAFLRQANFPETQDYMLDQALEQWYTKVRTNARQPINGSSLSLAADQIARELVGGSILSSKEALTIKTESADDANEMVAANELYSKDLVKFETLPCSVHDDEAVALVDEDNADGAEGYGDAEEAGIIMESAQVSQPLDETFLQGIAQKLNNVVQVNDGGISNYSDALRSLDPLWDFVWRMNDVPAINLLSELREHLNYVDDYSNQANSVG